MRPLATLAGIWKKWRTERAKAAATRAIHRAMVTQRARDIEAAMRAMDRLDHFLKG
jgi:hypothetical protein